MPIHRQSRCFALSLALSLALVAHIAAAADTLLGCYASLPSSFKLSNTYQYQTSSYCSDKCSGYAYFALSNHANCYCGNDNPASSESTADTCNTNCYGYGQEMCGGESSYSVYSTGNAAASSESSSSSAHSSSLSSSSSASSRLSSASSGTSSVSALNTDVNIVASTSAQTSDITSVVNGAGASSDQQGTSVVYSTTFHTEGGSTIFVTNTITQSALATGANSTSSHGSSTGANGSSHKKKANVGAIVGGVVGGVCGAIAIAVIALFAVRHYNMKREEDRMEKEYQEAIKPVEYNAATAAGANIMNDTLSFSSHSRDGDGEFGEFDHRGNKEDSGSANGGGMFRSSGSSGNIARPHYNNNNVNGNNGLSEPQNPFDDSKRISTGSVFTGAGAHGKGNVLTVVNPDQD